MLEQIGRYRLHQVLAQSDAAELFLAFFEVDGGAREVCRLWLSKPGHLRDPDGARELATNLLGLRHRSLPRVLQASSEEGRLAMAFEHQPGRRLATFISAFRKQHGPLPRDLSVHLITSILHGLKQALDLGPSPIWWTHGELRLELVGVTASGWIQVHHLGLANILQRGDGLEGAALLAACRRLSPRVDVVAVATMLRDLIEQGEAEPSSDLEELLSWALSSDGDRSFPNASELLRVLDDLTVPGPNPWSPDRIEVVMNELFGDELAKERAELDELIRKGAPSVEDRAWDSRKKHTIPPVSKGSIPPSGATIGGRYQVIREIGQGGMGVVIEAEHLELGTRFAIKMLDRDVSRDPDQVERFKREAKATSKIGHPNIVKVIDLGVTSEGRFYYVMDLIRGVSVAKLISIAGALDEERAIRIILQVCDALEAAHNHSIIHRDLKPENLMISSSPSERDMVKVVDFGLSVSLDPTEKRLTREGLTLGTPYYMAPEQVAGKPLDGRTDIYAIGAILYEMLTGYPPFEEETVAEVLTAHLRGELVPPRMRAPHAEISPGLEAVVVKALAKKPADRFQSMAEMGRAIREAALKGPAMFKLPRVPAASPIPRRAVALPILRDSEEMILPLLEAAAPEAAHASSAPDSSLEDGGESSPPKQVPNRVLPLLIVALLLGGLGGMLGYWLLQGTDRDDSGSTASVTTASSDAESSTPRPDVKMFVVDASIAKVSLPAERNELTEERPVADGDGGADGAVDGDAADEGPAGEGPPVEALLAGADEALRSGQHGKAAQLYQRVIWQSPGKSAAWAGLGQAQFEMGQHEAAARSLDRAVRASPRNVGYRVRLANALLRAGRRDQATQQYREVLKLSPNHPVARRMIERR
jgi:serine/threonine protein kinase